MSKRAIGIIRVSRVGGREGEAFHSPDVQRERIEGICLEHKWQPADTFEELDDSGKLPLLRRTGLLRAVEAIEARRAHVVVVAYFDRLCREPSVRDEVVDRVEAAGGEVWCADMGRTSNGTAAQKFTGGMLALASRFVLESAAEKARAAQVEAVEAGTWMSAAVPPGYLLGADRKLAPDPETAPLVEEAFRMRADGASIDAVRRHLLRHGIERTPKAVAKLLHSRTYLGELHFGDLQNPAAHDAIIDRPTWERAQRASAPRGRQPQSERLLARLGVLRCGTCGSRMSVTTSNYRYPAYRCGQPDCERRQTVSAPLVEGMVVEEVKRALADVEGRASAEQNIREAAAALDRAQAEYEKLIELLDPMEPAAAKRLGRAKDKRDKAQEHLDRLGGTSASLTVTAAGDWERLTLDERRALIRAVVGRAVVAPGRGTDRITIHLVGE